MEFPKVTERKVFYGRQMGSIEIPGYKALVNPDTEKTFGIFSNKYRPIKHENVIDMVEDTLTKVPEYGEFERKIILPNEGGKMRATYTFPEIEVPIERGDSVNPRVDVFNSYDGGWSFNLFFGAFRLVCMNGLVIGEKVLHYRKKHFLTFNEQDVKRLLIISMEKFSEQTELWKNWVDKVVSPSQYKEIMEVLPFGKKQTEEIEKEVEVSSCILVEDPTKVRTLTWWILFNILCQYVTHKVKSDLRRAEIENAMRRVF